MKTVSIIIAALAVGIAIGVTVCMSRIRYLRRRIKALRAGREPAGVFRRVTRFLFVTTQIFALVWVSVSYGVAVYATVALQQPFPVAELSEKAINALLGVGSLKVVENIFEHNEGIIFGHNTDSSPSGEEFNEGEGG